MIFIVYITLAIIIVMAVVMVDKNKNQKALERQQAIEKETIEEAIERYDIVPSLIEVQPSTNVYILDKKNKRIAYLSFNYSPHYNYSVTYYNFENIIEVSLVLDGETITNTARGSQLGGALVGGILAGGAGAVIGGLSSKTSSKEVVSQMYLKVTTSNSTNSANIMKFLNVREPILKSTDVFKQAFDNSIEWESELKVIIHKSQTNIQSTNEVTDKTSIADEIKKLHTLVEDGILTNEEFTLQKEKILSK